MRHSHLGPSREKKKGKGRGERVKRKLHKKKGDQKGKWGGTFPEGRGVYAHVGLGTRPTAKKKRKLGKRTQKV